MSDKSFASPERYLPSNSAGYYALQVLMGDRRHIAPYEGKQHIPYCITEKLTREACESFLNRVDPERVATFTARVPLDVITEGSAAIATYIAAHAFDFPVLLGSYEFRPVGAVIAEFDDPLAGEVLIQVKCSIFETDFKS